MAVALSACASGNAAKAPARCAMTTHDGKPLLLEWWRQHERDVHDGARVATDGSVTRNQSGDSWRASGALAAPELTRLQTLLRGSFTKLPPVFATDGDAASAASETWIACVDGKKRLVKVEGAAAVDDPALLAFRGSVSEILAAAK